MTTLSYNKFMIDTYDLPVDIRCTVCGHSDGFNDGLRLDDAIEWAESHDCPAPRLTAP